MRRTAGFTLVALLVVVAIIGTLAARATLVRAAARAISLADAQRRRAARPGGAGARALRGAPPAASLARGPHRPSPARRRRAPRAARRRPRAAQRREVRAEGWP